MLLEYKANRPSKAEEILFKLCHHQAPSPWAVTSYIANVVNLGVDRRSGEIAQSRHMPPELLPLLVSARKQRDGDLDGALHALEGSGGDYPVRSKIAHARRAIFHQKQDHSSLAIEGMKFLQDEPDRLLIPFTIATAGAAEYVKRDDILRFAIRRLLRDRDRIMNDPDLLRRFWNHGLSASLTVFDIDGAVTLLRKAKGLRVPGAAARLEDLLQVRQETEDWRDILDAVYQSMRAKIHDPSDSVETGLVKLVVPAAAFRKNPIDYPGFRSDIRFVVKTIARTLTSAGLDFQVTGQILNHGKLSSSVPSFSYHTISRDRKALHFKETDRPSRFSFDTGGYAGWSDFSTKSVDALDLPSVDYDEALAFFRSEQVSIIEGNISKYAQADLAFAETLPEKFVFIGLQVIGDAVQRLAYASPFAMMDEVIETCLEKGLSVVVKRHPQDKNGQISDDLRCRVEKGHITLSTASIHTLIAKSEAVCVINSGVGAEALLHEKPVYVFGRADYMQACFVCEHAGDFAKQFSLGRTRLPADQLHRFWYLLRNSYAVSITDREKSARWIRERVLRHLRETGVLSA
ncbi:MAG TPA: hypothetical protein VL202_24140 [Pararhizobium sp.]|uniref:capsular polysaccharide export protein, LipB/KpsS family n=1 Tax=Pararhizobium sp. TaxID=1977563 RepID=UPI002C6083EF|nr:hypothetical protein [Pararhizobium sp.]HTO34234.1 hypothetical protein [Pararhizobium sp.]